MNQNQKVKNAKVNEVRLYKKIIRRDCKNFK